MKITHIIFSMQTGGAETMLVDIMNEQVKLGHDVNLLIFNKEINNQLLSTVDKNVHISRLNRPEGSRNPYYLLKLYSILYLHKSDIVHTHNTSMGTILKYYNRPKIITVHTTGTYLPSLKTFDEVVSISKAVQMDLEANNCKSIIIYNGINIDKIKTSKNIPNDVYRILQISRLDHHNKGQDIAINALAILKEKDASLKVHLTFIGEGSSRQYLEALVDSLELKEDVSFLGLKDRNYIYQHLHTYDLLIQPSRYEGFGLTIIEGMAAKVPVLVSNIEGPMEVILSGNLGSWFVSEDANDLSKKILEHLYGSLDIKVEEAYKYVLGNYTIKKMVLEYLKVYNR